jgi:hypothetical protein
MKGQCMAQVYQRDKNNPGASKRARDAYWVEIEDCEGNKIVKKIGDYDLANRILNKFNYLKDEGNLFKKRFEMTIGQMIDEYLKAKRGNVANFLALEHQMNYWNKRFGQFKRYELTPQLFKQFRKEQTKVL